MSPNEKADAIAKIAQVKFVMDNFFKRNSKFKDPSEIFMLGPFGAMMK
jgi:hypothetical protein